MIASIFDTIHIDNFFSCLLQHFLQFLKLEIVINDQHLIGWGLTLSLFL